MYVFHIQRKNLTSVISVEKRLIEVRLSIRTREFMPVTNPSCASSVAKDFIKRVSFKSMLARRHYHCILLFFTKKCMLIIVSYLTVWGFALLC